jgi:two-component system response regulator RegX3
VPLTATDPQTPTAPRTAGRLRLLTLGPCQANLDGKQLRVHDAVVPLPLIEFELLAVLLDNAGRIMTRDELLDAVWHGACHRSKTVNLHIQRLRDLLAAHPDAQARLRTVRGLGYVFDP